MSCTGKNEEILTDIQAKHKAIGEAAPSAHAAGENSPPLTGSLPVWEARHGETAPVKTWCERYGWPNRTATGEVMYDNTHFPNEKQVVRMPAWTASKVEEIIAVAWLVAGCSAWNAGIRWLGWVCFVKAALDTICAIGVALIEISEESAKRPNGKLCEPAGGEDVI